MREFSRYDLCDGDLEYWSDGEYMEVEDHEKIVAAIEKERNELLAALGGDQELEIGACYFVNQMLPLFEFLGDDSYRWHYYGRHTGTSGPPKRDAYREFDRRQFYKVFDSRGRICDEETGRPKGGRMPLIPLMQERITALEKERDELQADYKLAMAERELHHAEMMEKSAAIERLFCKNCALEQERDELRAALAAYRNEAKDLRLALETIVCQELPACSHARAESAERLQQIARSACDNIPHANLELSTGKSVALADLLDAVRLIQPDDDWTGWENADGVGIADKMHAAIDQARQVLKARGEQEEGE
jgi:hypothetical protein